jgi:dienelactone hydrolase
MTRYTGPLLLALLAIGACAAPATTPLVIDDASVGAPLSGETGELYRPAGAGPFPAVVVLHGCTGVASHYRQWAQLLAQWGYVALLVDSFGPRGYTEICNRGNLVPAALQAADAFAAARYLRAQPYIRADRIGVIGFAHGGWAVLKAVLAGSAPPQVPPPFADAVAFYPGCDPPGLPLETDTLILIGTADDWTSASAGASLPRPTGTSCG